MFCLPVFIDQGQEIKYFCRISLVMYLVLYNHSISGPDFQVPVRGKYEHKDTRVIVVS